MKRKFTPSRDGKLRATFRVEVRLTEEEIARVIGHDAACREEKPRPIGRVLLSVIGQGWDSFWQDQPLKNPGEEES